MASSNYLANFISFHFTQITQKIVSELKEIALLQISLSYIVSKSKY